MGQILRIFRKDIRHFRLEIACSLLAIIAFNALYPAMWGAEGSGFFLLNRHFNMQGLAGVVTALIPLTWFVLIIRLFQDENPVGDRAYWLTKPYEWPKLLAAKALFLAAFVYLPFAISQVVLLRQAGFDPRQSLFGIGFNLICTTVILIVPCAALAVVTANFLKAALSLLGVARVVVLIALVATEGSPSISIPFSDELSPAMVLVVCATAVIAMYTARRVWVSRALLLSLIVFLFVAAINPFETKLLEQVYYPLPKGSGAIPIRMSVSSVADRLPTVSEQDDRHVELHLPVEIGGVPYGYVVEPDDVKVRVTGRDGVQIVSGWNAMHGHSYRSDTRGGMLEVPLDRALYTRMRGQHVRIQVELALTEAEAGADERFTMPASGSLRIPGFGLCDPVEQDADRSAALHCRYAMGQPGRTLLTAWVAKDTCPRDGSPPAQSFPATSSTGGYDRDPAEFGITSVWDAELSFGFHGPFDEAMYGAPRTSICKGALVTATAYRVVHRERYQFVAEDVSLPE